jgi:aminoglycoside phosphotransferase family enzyme/predicted kinase
MSDPEVEQANVISFLKRRLGDDLQERRTHISVVLLGRDIVWKLKRAVALPYVDFSTVASRLDDCEREVVLNRRTAPTLYRGVRRVTRSDDGLVLDGDGELVDAVVEMARFPSEDLLAEMVARGALTPKIVARLAQVIGAFHLEARPVAGDGAARMRRVIEGNAEALRMSEILDSRTVELYCAACDEALARLRDVLDRRAGAGAIIRAHGDLHLQNIFMWQGEPTLFDCLEFDDELATIDRLYDLSFLLMDLWRRGFPQFANLAFNRYLDVIDDEAALSLLPFFMSVRAAIRAHVVASQAHDDDEKAQEARAYLELAQNLLEPKTPTLVAIGGFSGSGKSTVAAAVAHVLGPAPGARVIGSDRIRKAMHGATPEQKLPPAAYRPEVTQRVYEALAERAEKILSCGHAALAEATFSTPSERASIEAAASKASVQFQGVWLKADPTIMARRVAQRVGDVSDADVEVLARQVKTGAGQVNWPSVNAAGSVADVVKKAVELLRPLA